MSVLLVEQGSDGVRVLVLNRPERRNALDSALLEAIAADLRHCEKYADVRCVILAGDERAFSAGADIHEMRQAGAAIFLEEGRRSAWSTIESFSKPLIAAVEGPAFGSGNELVLLADIVVAGADARFGQPEAAVGGMPGDGGTQRLVRAVGKGAAMQMILSGKPISASEAYRLGLVTQLCPKGSAVAVARTIAADVAAAAPLAVRNAKRALLAAFELPLSEGLKMERRAMLELISTADRQEGLQAFTEKRPPRFQGR